MGSRGFHCTPKCHSYDVQSTTVTFVKRQSAPKTVCFLLDKLPLELRREIYSLVLGSASPVYTPLGIRDYMDMRHRAYFTIPRLAWVSRQIRSEVLQVYLGDNAVRAELIDKVDLDILFFERALAGLHETVALIRHLTLRHKVDFYLSPCNSSTTSWASTGFRVQHDGAVDVQCDWRKYNDIEDEIPAGAVCTCPIKSKLQNLKQSPPGVPAGTTDCALTRAIYSFLALVDQESRSPSYYQDRYGFGRFDHRKIADWPLCEDCGFRRWFVQGPRSAKGKTIHGLREGEVMYKGTAWRVCGVDPRELILQPPANRMRSANLGHSREMPSPRYDFLSFRESQVI